jgi:ribosomal protein S7
MRAGNKKTVNRALSAMFKLLKMRYFVNPLEIVLESLEKVKPIFGVGRARKSRKVVREFPVFLSKQQQFQLVIFLFKGLVLARKEKCFSHRLFKEFCDLRENRRYTLLKDRDAVFKAAVVTRFNLRFAYK